MSTAPAEPARHRLGELDALRGIAAFGVVIHHYLSRYGDLYGHSAAFPYRFDSGQLGVHLFFMVSGFVILMTLQRTRTASDFLVSRAARLYPAYWFAVLVSGALLLLAPLPDTDFGIDRVLINLTMFQRALGTGNVDEVYWTLSVELAFYFIMLGLWRIGGLRNIPLLAAVWLTGEALWCLGVELGLLGVVGSALKAPFLWNFAHLFVAGMLFHRLYSGERSWRIHVLLAGCLALQGTLGWETFPAAALFYAVFYLVAYDRLRVLAVRPLLFLGTISYSLYLLHQIPGFEIIRAGYALGVHPLISVAVATAAAIALATAATYWIEQPALAAIRGWWKRRKESSATRGRILPPTPTAPSLP